VKSVAGGVEAVVPLIPVSEIVVFDEAAGG